MLGNIAPETVAEYRSARRKGVPAINAYHIATADPPEYRLDEDTLEFRDDETGFRIVFDTDIDPFDDATDWLGTWTDTWTDGAVRNPRAFYMTEHGPEPYSRREHHLYFVPAETEESLVKAYRRMKRGRADARRMAREQTERALQHALEYESLMLRCRVYSGSVCLAVSSIGGCDVTGASYSETWAYLSEMADDLAAECLEQAETEACRIADAAASLDCNGR